MRFAKARVNGGSNYDSLKDMANLRREKSQVGTCRLVGRANYVTAPGHREIVKLRERGHYSRSVLTHRGNPGEGLAQDIVKIRRTRS